MKCPVRSQHNREGVNPDNAIGSLLPLFITSNPFQKLKNHRSLCFYLFFMEFLCKSFSFKFVMRFSGLINLLLNGKKKC